MPWVNVYMPALQATADGRGPLDVDVGTREAVSSVRERADSALVVVHSHIKGMIRETSIACVSGRDEGMPSAIVLIRSVSNPEASATASKGIRLGDDVKRPPRGSARNKGLLESSLKVSDRSLYASAAKRKEMATAFDIRESKTKRARIDRQLAEAATILQRNKPLNKKALVQGMDHTVTVLGLVDFSDIRKEQRDHILTELRLRGVTELTDNRMQCRNG